jgi:hypothetical protein
MVAVISGFIRGNKGSKDKNATVWVIEAPEENPTDSRQVPNMGHALVVPKVTDGMSSKLVKHLAGRMSISPDPL